MKARLDEKSGMPLKCILNLRPLSSAKTRVTNVR